MSFFKKDTPCTSMKVWSRQELTDDMLDFGVAVYKQFNKHLTDGECSAAGCGFFNEAKNMSAFAKKTKGGLGSVMVRDESKDAQE